MLTHHTHVRERRWACGAMRGKYVVFNSAAKFELQRSARPPQSQNGTTRSGSPALRRK